MWNICHIQSTHTHKATASTIEKRTQKEEEIKRKTVCPVELTSLQTIFNFYKALNVEQIKRGACSKKKNRQKVFCISIGQREIKSKVQNYRSKMSKI